MRKNTANVIGITAFTLSLPFLGQQKRLITPADCITVRYLKSGNNTHPRPLSVSPDGRVLAYLVTTPDLESNKNSVSLYVKALSEDRSDRDKPLLMGDLDSIQWLRDSQHLTALVGNSGRREIEEVDTRTGEHETLVRAADDIVEYRSDETGSIIVYAVAVSNNERVQPTSEQDISHGYRIPFKREGQTAWPQKKLFITRRLRDGWTKPTQIVIESPFTLSPLPVLTSEESLFLSLSPDGKELLIDYFDLAKELPARWRQNPTVRSIKRAGFLPGTRVLVLYRTDTGTTSLPLETPYADSIALWSSDSHSFAVFARSPVGSTWAAHDADKSGEDTGAANLFWVQPAIGKVELIATHEQAPYPYGPPLHWGTDDSLLIGSLDGTITRFDHVGDQWHKRESFSIPIKGFGKLASDGEVIIGDRQSAAEPPELFIYRPGDAKVAIFAKLNPQFDNLALAAVESINWQTSTGLNVQGTLFLPPDFISGTRYPLVIQTKPYGGNWFACDFGPAHYPSFIPQPLASAGIAYLSFYYPGNGDGKTIPDYYPKSYPGRIAEAALETDVYDNAVKTLADRGLIDSKKVGIIGFSRSGWYTEFALMFGKIRYRAATAVDNVAFSFSEYALGPVIGSNSGGTSAMYGGPPTGATLKNWLDYSVSFNLDKIHTPLLMEEMGYGNLFDRQKSPPIFVTMPFEIFTGLNQLKKPVEFYYYPNEEHEPDHPQARLANMQRNLDWYRFWLQGYEDPDPAKRSQYQRWEKLKELRDADDSSM